MTERDGIPLPQAALQLGRGYQSARDAVLRGELQGWQVAGRWLVSRESVRALQERDNRMVKEEV